MYFSPVILASIALVATKVTSAPVPQLAGEGSACNSIVSNVDNGVGYGVEDAEDNVAGGISKLNLRQLAGEGSACNSIVSNVDNGVGYGIKNAEENLANNVASAKKTGRRQLDKISDGFQDLSEAAGTGDSTSSTTSELDTLDGESTSGAANLGAQIGDTEASTLEAIGSGSLGNLNSGSGQTGGTGSGGSPPPPPPGGPGGPKGHPRALGRRQMDKIAHGFQNIADAAKVGGMTSAVSDGLVNLDGTLTNDGADAGAEIGDVEVGTLEAVGSAVP